MSAAPTRGATTTDGSKFWVPPGRSVQVRHQVLPQGAIYVGRGLASTGGWRSEIEPALIDPKLSAIEGASYHESHDMGYWSSYAHISPAARGAYLNWLATSSLNDPATDIGFVFLFFYGLERRVLIDVQDDDEAQKDIPEIRRIVRDLRRVYGEKSRSFGRYSAAFLDLIETCYPPDPSGPPLAKALTRRTDDQSLRIRMGLGLRVRTGLPIDRNWALCWTRNDPDISLRLPASRCADEFNRLFVQRFAQKYSQGLKIPANKTPLRVDYRPASPGIEPISRPIEIAGQPVPDVMILKRPKRTFQELADSCVEDLAPYSRWLGKNPDDPHALPGLALLPKELLRECRVPTMEGFIARLDWTVSGGDAGMLGATELFQVWPTSRQDRFSKPEAVRLFQLLEALGYGIEPDVRFGSPRLTRDRRIVLFPLSPDAPSAPSVEYAEAATLLLLAAQVCHADGVSEEEETHLERLIEERLRLSGPEQLRLRAYLRFLVANPIDTSGLKKRLEQLHRADAESVADLLVEVAAADGRVDPGEVDILWHLFRRLGLDEQGLHGRLHVATSQSAGRAGARATGDTGTKVPEKTRGIRLNPEHLRQRQESTQRVAALLQGVFADPDEEEKKEVAASATAPEHKIDGLDGAHSALFVALGERDDWDRDAFAELTGRLGLMPEGAVDRLNEAAFELCDAPLLDGDDDGYALDRETWEGMQHGEAA
ncbi:MAG: TerB N-terminal domain-containing protein [Candidatus Thiosymbion ectosymbiont of Robbea hypermnestra]|nr:TerB N-terminal domain-containing protein [Candidatus Thiosymbion ectosymbiont of Robbea hypermnestra]